MAESLCQKRALEAFRLDPAKWGGRQVFLYGNEPGANFSLLPCFFLLSEDVILAENTYLQSIWRKSQYLYASNLVSLVDITRNVSSA